MCWQDDLLDLPGVPFTDQQQLLGPVAGYDTPPMNNSPAYTDTYGASPHYNSPVYGAEYTVNEDYNGAAYTAGSDYSSLVYASGYSYGEPSPPNDGFSLDSAAIAAVTEQLGSDLLSTNYLDALEDVRVNSCFVNFPNAVRSNILIVFLVQDAVCDAYVTNAYLFSRKNTSENTYYTSVHALLCRQLPGAPVTAVTTAMLVACGSSWTACGASTPPSSTTSLPLAQRKEIWSR